MTKWNLSRVADRSQRELQQAVDERTAQLRAAKEAADRASRSKSEFLANISHEIRTPLTAILGFTRLLMDGALPDERNEYLEIIRASAEHQLLLINDLLDLSKVEAGQMQIRRVGCSARRIIDEVLQTLRYRADEKGLALSSQWVGPDDRVFTDPSRLRQLLINLVNNAIKFTPSGSVHIRAGVELLAGSRTLKIEVADTGIGIDASKQQAIFEPFVQADGTIAAQYGGTGLGLAISRSIAGLLGGQLAVTSRVGVGSTFTLTISAGSPDAAHAAAANGVEAHATVAGASLRGRRILLAEDNPHNRKLLQIALTRAGAQVELAENGQVAVDRAQANEFDLVLMDMQMPVLDGFTAAARLRRSNYRGPIVALTAHALPAERERCLAEGCDAFISKPVDLDHLLEVIHQLLSSRERLGAACLLDSDRGCGTGDEQELHEVAREYVASLHNTVVELRTALADRRYDELAAAGHTLKGSGGTIGYPQVSAIGQRLEQAAHEQLEGTAQKAICDLEEFLGSPQNS